MQLPFPILHGFALQRFSFRQELVINCTYMLHISIIIFSDHYIHIHKYTIGVQKVFCNVLFAVEMLFIYRCRSICFHLYGMPLRSVLSVKFLVATRTAITICERFCRIRDFLLCCIEACSRFVTGSNVLSQYSGL